MNKKMKELFTQLNHEWTAYAEPSSNCWDTQDLIMREIGKMDSDDVRLMLHRLSDAQIGQITGIVGEIVEAFPATLGTLLNISKTRKLFWLRDELRVIGVAA